MNVRERNLHAQDFHIRHNHNVTSSQSVLFNKFRRWFDDLLILTSAYLKPTLYIGQELCYFIRAIWLMFVRERNLITQAFHIRHNHYVTSSQSVLFNQI